MKRRVAKRLNKYREPGSVKKGGLSVSEDELGAV